jgi:hypothetical protein
MTCIVENTQSIEQLLRKLSKALIALERAEQKKRKAVPVRSSPRKKMKQSMLQFST